MQKVISARFICRATKLLGSFSSQSSAEHLTKKNEKTRTGMRGREERQRERRMTAGMSKKYCETYQNSADPLKVDSAHFRLNSSVCKPYNFGSVKKIEAANQLEEAPIYHMPQTSLANCPLLKRFTCILHMC